ncbi:MAG: hypothetical protein AB7I59_15225 [Geminicoccaceae bacterium]
MFPTPSRFAALLAAGLVLTSLSAPAGAIESFDYEPPSRAPKGELSRFVQESPELVLEQIWAFVEQQGFTIESVNPRDHVLVARYSGDPRPFLDCGVVEALVDERPVDPPRQYSANRAEVRTSRSPKGRRVGLLRRLNLDARLVVRVEPRGDGSRVFANSIYVATKSVNRLRKGGRADELIDREVISFQSNEEGRFSKGTICVPNGKLEAVPLNLFKTS